MIDATNRMLSSGRPRIVSMNSTHITLTTGMSDLRPSARKIAAGKAMPIAITVRINVTGKPPHDEVGT